MARDYDRAVTELHKVVEIWPQFELARIQLATELVMNGHARAALAELDRIEEAYGGRREAMKVVAHVAAGDHSAARRVLDELYSQQESDYVSPLHFSIAHGWLGDMDRAFDWLEQAYKERAGELARFDVNPTFDALRVDPRFQEMLRRMKLD